MKSNWNVETFGDVADFLRGPFGSAVKKSVCVEKNKGPYKLYEQGHVLNNDFQRGKYYLTEEKFQELKKFEIVPGDLLLTCAGTLGQIAVVPKNIERGVFNSVLMRIRVDDSKVLKKFFLYYFQSPIVQNRISGRSYGAVITNLFATKDLKAFPFPVPPLDIQQQIVDVLERAEQLKEKRNAANEDANMLIQSLFASMFLNEEDEFEQVLLGDVFEIVRGGSPRPIKEYITEEEDGLNWIKIGDTKSDSKYITTTQEKIKPSGLKKTRMVHDGDFLLSNSMSFGRPYIVKIDGCVHDGWLIIRDKDKRTNNDFLYSVLSSSFVYAQFLKMASGTTVKNLNIDAVRKVRIPLPPTNLQNQFSEYVSQIEMLLMQQTKSTDEVNFLFDSLMQRVFSGIES